MATIITEKGNSFGSDFRNTRFISLHTVKEKSKKGYPLLISLKEC